MPRVRLSVQPRLRGRGRVDGLAPVDSGAPSEDATSDVHVSETPTLDAATPTRAEAPETGEDDVGATLCDPTSCTGCCDDAGSCQAGDSLDVCGVGGGPCQVCPGRGTSCSNGLCQVTQVTPLGPCEALTCPGCCDSTGTCQPGQSVASCGTHGATCTACDDETVCSNGSCQSPDLDGGPCVASSCAECIPVYQAACCKADQTCGCQVLFGGALPDAGNACN